MKLMLSFIVSLIIPLWFSEILHLIGFLAYEDPLIFAVSALYLPDRMVVEALIVVAVLTHLSVFVALLLTDQFPADELHLVAPFPLPHDVWLRLHLLLLK